MKIGYVVHFEDVGGVEYHRLYKPLSLIGFEVVRCVGADKSILDMGLDVVIFNRHLPCVKQTELINDLRKAGIYIICDLDDSWMLDSSHYLAKYWKVNNLKARIIGAIMASDEVWVTHQHLANLVTPLNSNVYVIPNAIDSDEQQWKPTYNGNGRIGWTGSITHVNDLLLTDGSWNGIEPVICGYVEGEPEWTRLSNNLPATYVKGLDVWNYAMLYDQFDIAIAPLTDAKFNTYKSNLKILEAGFKGKPIFVQDMHPYTDKAKGIYHVSNWFEGIRTASRMSDAQIEDEGMELMSYCFENYDLNKINNLRKERLL